MAKLTVKISGKYTFKMRVVTGDFVIAGTSNDITDPPFSPQSLSQLCLTEPETK